jgi:D-alanyl-D-alanine dipeptidase
MKVFYTVIFFGIAFTAASQNRYGLNVIQTKSAYNITVVKKPGKAMVDVRKKIKKIAFELRYADSNNFTHQQLYPAVTTTYLRKDAAQVLAAVQRELSTKNLGLKIFDAYRPYSVTEQMWELVEDDRYAADPAKGSGHNRGIAVDLTIINLKTKQELNMGTGFDNFTDSAHHDFKALPAAILQNRLMLKTLMEKHGFSALATEWWHYSLPNAKDYELLDLSFSELKELVNE